MYDILKHGRGDLWSPAGEHNLVGETCGLPLRPYGIIMKILRFKLTDKSNRTLRFAHRWFATLRYAKFEIFEQTIDFTKIRDIIK